MASGGADGGTDSRSGRDKGGTADDSSDRQHSFNHGSPSGNLGSDPSYLRSRRNRPAPPGHAGGSQDRKASAQQVPAGNESYGGVALGSHGTGHTQVISRSPVKLELRNLLPELDNSEQGKGTSMPIQEGPHHVLGSK